MDLRVAPLARRAVASEPATEAVAIHSSFLPGAEDALEDGDRVFLALASEGLEREMVAYVLIRHADGSYDFAGDCAAFTMSFLQGALGGRQDEVLDRIVGLTDRSRIQAILGDLP